jgi:hypothetical protein
MARHREELKRTPEHRQPARPSRRFQMEKLEEQIAPLCSLVKVTPSGKLIWHCSHSKLA